MVSIKLLVLCAAVAVALGKIDNGKSCLLKKSDCNDNAECKNAETNTWNCLYGTCVCKSGYSQTSATKCDAYKTFDQDCEVNQNQGKMCDFSKYLTCKLPGKKCDCKSDKFERDGSGCKIKEAEKKELEETCADHEQCVKGVPSNSAFCTATKCKCGASWTTFNKNCLEQKRGSSCKDGTASEKCRAEPNLECKNDKCECKTDFVWKEWKGMTKDLKMCIHKDSKTNRAKGETCHVAAPNDNKWNICSGSLGCRKCSTDNTDTGLCVDLSELGQKDCSGSSTISASVALLLTAVLAYLAY